MLVQHHNLHLAQRAAASAGPHRSRRFASPQRAVLHALHLKRGLAAHLTPSPNQRHMLDRRARRRRRRARSARGSGQASAAPLAPLALPAHPAGAAIAPRAHPRPCSRRRSLRHNSNPLLRVQAGRHWPGRLLGRLCGQCRSRVRRMCSRSAGLRGPVTLSSARRSRVQRAAAARRRAPRASRARVADRSRSRSGSCAGCAACAQHHGTYEQSDGVCSAPRCC
jgi:hypothetical protein